MVESDNDSSIEPFNVVIVGAGMAGLTCARELLGCCDGIHVTVVEAASVAGGRVRTIPVPPGVEGSCFLDAGAEFIHGRGHILWDTIRDFQRHGKLPMTTAPTRQDEEPLEFEALEEHFILAFADGGPQDKPTRQGKYGMYFFDDELVMYDDPKIRPLVDVLETISNSANAYQYTDDTSVADALAADGMPPLSDSLMQLCVAGYGNTAGCCDLNQLSIRALMAFEAYWESNEVEGDYRPTFGMYRLVDAMVQDLQEYNKTSPHKFTLLLNTPVERILPAESHATTSDIAVNEQGTNTSINILLDASVVDSSSLLCADAVVVTVPPTRLPQLFNDGHDLSPSKREALTRIGFADRIVKICCKFKSSSLWPPNLQSIIAAGQPIPELWFREMEGSVAFVVVGYLVSTAANMLVQQIRAMQAEAKLLNQLATENCAEQIMLHQLSTMFQVPIEGVEKECFLGETLVVDWKEDFPYIQGGYSFPKTGIIIGRDIQALAEPMMNGRILFAGEATNTCACCTVQAAMETGIRAAKEIIATFL